MFLNACENKWVTPDVNYIHESNDKKNITEKINYIASSPERFYFLNKIVMQNKIITNKNEGTKKPVAIYGFSKNQMALLKFIREDLSINKGVLTIATLNHMLDLIKYERDQLNNKKGIAEKGFIISYISKLGNYSVVRNKKSISTELINAWVDVLKNNINKIDVFAYVNSKGLTESNKNILIKKLILKNTSSKSNADSLFNVLDEIKLFDLSNIKEVCDYLSNNTLLLSDVYAIFELIQTHFFRNTSKLGLDFFKDNGYAISIVWNADGFGSKVNNKMIALEDVSHKFFNQGKRRFNNAEPITYSEIRHLIKHQSSFDDIIYRISFQRESILFSSGINNENWFEYKKSNLLSSLFSCVMS